MANFSIYKYTGLTRENTVKALDALHQLDTIHKTFTHDEIIQFYNTHPKIYEKIKFEDKDTLSIYEIFNGNEILREIVTNRTDIRTLDTFKLMITNLHVDDKQLFNTIIEQKRQEIEEYINSQGLINTTVAIFAIFMKIEKDHKVSDLDFKQLNEFFDLKRLTDFAKKCDDFKNKLFYFCVELHAWNEVFELLDSQFVEFNKFSDYSIFSKFEMYFLYLKIKKIVRRDAEEIRKLENKKLILLALEKQSDFGVFNNKRCIEIISEIADQNVINYAGKKYCRYFLEFNVPCNAKEVIEARKVWKVVFKPCAYSMDMSSFNCGIAFSDFSPNPSQNIIVKGSKLGCNDQIVDKFEKVDDFRENETSFQESSLKNKINSNNNANNTGLGDDKSSFVTFSSIEKTLNEEFEIEYSSKIFKNNEIKSEHIEKLEEDVKIEPLTENLKLDGNESEKLEEIKNDAEVEHSNKKLKIDEMESKKVEILEEIKNDAEVEHLNKKLKIDEMESKKVEILEGIKNDVELEQLNKSESGNELKLENVEKIKSEEESVPILEYFEWMNEEEKMELIEFYSKKHNSDDFFDLLFSMTKLENCNFQMPLNPLNYLLILSKMKIDEIDENSIEEKLCWVFKKKETHRFIKQSVSLEIFKNLIVKHKEKFSKPQLKLILKKFENPFEVIEILPIAIFDFINIYDPMVILPKILHFLQNIKSEEFAIKTQNYLKNKVLKDDFFIEENLNQIKLILENIMENYQNSTVERNCDEIMLMLKRYADVFNKKIIIKNIK